MICTVQTIDFLLTPNRKIVPLIDACTLDDVEELYRANTRLDLLREVQVDVAERLLGALALGRVKWVTRNTLSVQVVNAAYGSVLYKTYMSGTGLRQRYFKDVPTIYTGMTLAGEWALITEYGHCFVGSNFRMLYFDEELSDILSCFDFRSGTTTNPRVSKRV